MKILFHQISILVIIIVGLTGCNRPSKFSHDYIAHAGGAIEGYTYTNSLEAFDNAIQNSIGYIELDLCVTSDSQLVASHEWMGCETWYNDSLPPTYTQFMSHRVYGKFTPLDYHRIDSLMIVHPEVVLVTDKISDPYIIQKYFSIYKNRLIVECFTDDDYFELKQCGYNVYRSEIPRYFKSSIIELIRTFNMRNFRILSYAFSQKNLKDGQIRKRIGDCYAVFCCENRAVADKLFETDSRIRFCYIDNIEIQ